MFTSEYSNGRELSYADSHVDMKQPLELGGVKMHGAAGVKYKRRALDEDFGEAPIKRGQGMSCLLQVAIANKLLAFYMEVDSAYRLASKIGAPPETHIREGPKRQR